MIFFKWSWKVIMSFHSEFNLLDLTLQYANNAQNPKGVFNYVTLWSL